MTPKTLDVARVRAERLPVICDNQMVLDWPSDVPVIGFRHGVAWQMLAAGQNFDVQVIDPALAFGDAAALLRATREFLASLASRVYQPRAWVTEHASRAAWASCLLVFDRQSWKTRT